MRGILRRFSAAATAALRPFELTGTCTGCGSPFQAGHAGASGYIDVAGLRGRLFLAEKPHGLVPVLKSDVAARPPRPGGFTRLEMQRIMKRFGEAEPPTATMGTGTALPATRKQHTEIVCARCFSLSHHGSGSSPCQDVSLALPDAGWQALHGAIGPRSLLVKIVDLTDLPWSFAGDIYSLLRLPAPVPTLLVGNKADLLPGHGASTVAQATACLREMGRELDLVDTLLVSAKSGFNMDRLHKAVLGHAASARESVFLAGRTNVGKSLVYNSFLAPGSARSTVSRVHGTTTGLLRKRLASVQTRLPAQIPRHLHLYDIPGFFTKEPDLTTAFFTKPELDALVLSSRAKPIRHTLQTGQVGILAGFARIDVEGDVELQLFMESSLPYFRRPIGTSSALLAQRGLVQTPPPSLRPPFFDGPEDPRQAVPLEEAVRFVVGPPGVSADAVFGGGIGWIAFGGTGTVTISTPGGVGVRSRTPPLRSRFL